jgi:nitrate reductase gamma subunit
MSFVTFLYALVFYFATAVLVVGLGRKIYQYARTPAPLKIPTTPAPTTRSGAALRVVREVALFESLFKSTKWTWLFGWIFHISLFLVLARHIRYFQEPVWGWVQFIQPFGKYAAFGMVIGLAGLWGRRLLVARVKYISAPSDHLMLALLIAIGASGVLMSGLLTKFGFPDAFSAHTDIVALKAFFLGLMTFNWQPLPGDPILLIHLTLVASLMIIFPFSKLLHAPGVFFSPTRNQVENPREQRHIVDWAARL